eukprot:TRINITY_DN6065_c0_g1_i1.p1 TRINITY_DN6065_c0_g1~~TRINITY_DN6065_c0_g1_i1.p1  ORF type:complete len:1395 (+),score=344.46 TRINITY_DN6065_c0_g1_i1:106-4185(+)
MSDLSDSESDDRGGTKVLGNAFIGALRSGSSANLYAAKKPYDDDDFSDDNDDDHHSKDLRQKHLINPLTYGNPDIDYADLFGDEVSAEEPGIWIWRIEMFDLVPVDPPTYGQFYTKDSYVVCHVSADDRTLVVHIHHWIGKEATADKFGSSAIYSVYLNHYLGGACRVVREVEGEESEQFVDYFGVRLEHLFGGTECAFVHVEPEPKVPLLYQLLPKKAGKDALLRLVELSNQSLDRNYVFLLDIGDRVFQWNGDKTTSRERFVAYDIAVKINKQERKSKTSLVWLDQGVEDRVTDEESADRHLLYETELFWKFLGGPIAVEDKDPEKVPTKFEWFEDEPCSDEEDAAEEEDEILVALVRGSWDDFKEDTPLVTIDDKYSCVLPLLPGKYLFQFKIVRASGDVAYRIDEELDVEKDFYGKEHNVIVVTSASEPELTLYKTTVVNGKLNLVQVEERPLRQDHLDSNHAYLLDAQSEVFVWNGKRAPPVEKKVARALANKFIGMDRVAWARLTSFYEDHESVSFKEKFAEWSTPYPNYDSLYLRSGNKPLPSPDHIDALQLFQSEPIEYPPMVDDGSGTAEVWVITAPGPVFEKVQPAEVGVFHSASCYMVLYSYRDNNDGKRQKYIAYFWEGRESCSSKWWPSFLYGFFPLLTKKIGGYGRLTPVRVFQQREPQHFMEIMDGLLTIRRGKRTMLRRRINRQVSLFDLRKTDSWRSHAIEVPVKPEALDSRDTFVLKSEDRMFVWTGKHSSPSEEILAKNMCDKINTQSLPISLVEEGRETAEFWTAIGGEIDRPFVSKMERPPAPRMFECSCITGEFKVDEIRPFSPNDVLLAKDDCLLLDAHHTVFLWRGWGCSESVFNLTSKLAEKYVSHARSSRSLDVPLAYVNSFEEPVEFTSLFHAWGSVEDIKIADPFQEQSERMAELERQRIRLQLKEEKLERRKWRRNKGEEAHVASMKKVDWAKELAANGIDYFLKKQLEEKEAARKRQDPAAKLAGDDHRTVFKWPDNEDALAVMVSGDWSDEADSLTPLIRVTTEKEGDMFVTALDIPPGRYRYRFKVATHDGTSWCTDKAHPVVVDAQDRSVNVLRVWPSSHPTENGVAEGEDKENEDTNSSSNGNSNLDPSMFLREYKPLRTEMEIKIAKGIHAIEEEAKRKKEEEEKSLASMPLDPEEARRAQRRAERLARLGIKADEDNSPSPARSRGSTSDEAPSTAVLSPEEEAIAVRAARRAERQMEREKERGEVDGTSKTDEAAGDKGGRSSRYSSAGRFRREKGDSSGVDDDASRPSSTGRTRRERGDSARDLDPPSRRRERKGTGEDDGSESSGETRRARRERGGTGERTSGVDMDEARLERRKRLGLA